MKHYNFQNNYGVEEGLCIYIQVFEWIPGFNSIFPWGKFKSKN